MWERDYGVALYVLDENPECGPRWLHVPMPIPYIVYK